MNKRCVADVLRNYENVRELDEFGFINEDIRDRREREREKELIPVRD